MTKRLRRGLFSMYFRLGVMRGGMPLMIVRQEAVQSHLGLRPEQVARIRDLVAEHDGLNKEFWNLPNADPVQARKKFRENLDAALNSLTEILEPAQSQRLHQIVLQRQGVWALSTPEVADQLALTSSQRSAIYQIQEAGFRWPRDGHEPNSPSPDERIRQVLTEPQRDAWQQMLGEPTDLGKWGHPPRRPRPKKPAPGRTPDKSRDPTRVRASRWPYRKIAPARAKRLTSARGASRAIVGSVCPWRSTTFTEPRIRRVCHCVAGRNSSRHSAQVLARARNPRANDFVGPSDAGGRVAGRDGRCLQHRPRLGQSPRPQPRPR